MKRKNFLFLASVVLIITLSIAGLWYHFIPKKIFTCIFVRLSPAQTPITQIKIEDQYYPIEISLSSADRISLHKDILDKIKDKQPNGIRKFNDIKNNEFETPIYILPKVQIARVEFSNECVEEKKDLFRINALLPTVNKADSENLSRVGIRLLSISNLLLDLDEFKIYLSNDEKRLRRSGYHLEDFVKVPLILDGRGVRVEINTDFGIRKFSIDTGTAKSFVNSSGVPNTNLKEENDLKIITSSKFAIGNMDFGSQDLYLLDLPSEAKDFEGILGMDFLRSHILYIDYKNKWVYIRNALP